MAGVEVYIMVGAAAYLYATNDDDTVLGSDGDNRIYGLGGADVLWGGKGNDTLYGGAGQDRLWGEEGDDTLYAGPGGGGLNGGAGNDRLYGSADNDGIYGDEGNDLLSSGGGDDRLDGGEGFDTASYAYSTSGVVVDLSHSSGMNSIEALIGSRFNDSLIGDAGVNRLTGGAGNDELYGKEGNDVLIGGLGADKLDGGAGVDTASYADATTGVTINLGAAGPQAGDTLISIERLIGSRFNDRMTGDAGVNRLVGGAGNDTLSGLAGNDVLDGGAGNDALNGGAGADTMIGGAGDDTYVVDNVADVVTEAANGGADLVQSAVTYTLGANVEHLTLTGTANINGTGNAISNRLTGNAGANILDGGGAADYMLGGAGKDTYIVDSVGEVLYEAASAGVDTVRSSVSFTLAANIENLALTGAANMNATGNELANRLTGNAGDDVLDGRAGADRMSGGAGNDIYIVDNAGDLVIETANAGVDIVQSSVSFTLGANVEQLTLAGAANIDATGNALGNRLTGNSGNNILDGGRGADNMIGGTGNDTYVVDNAGDVVVEGGGAGVDTVRSSATYALSGNVENLTLTGTAAIAATGNELDNLLIGNGASNRLDGGAGNDRINGGLGKDVLTGGAGSDVFVFDTGLALTNIDRVADFSAADDTIWLDNAVFAALADGALSAGAFKDVAAGPVDADDRIIYNSANGALSYDADGSGTAHQRVMFATLTGAPTITAADFLVI